MQTIKLKKPLTVNGKEYKELSYDLDELTAYDMDRAGKLLKDDGSFVNIIELDAGYHFRIFCVAVTKQHSDIDMTDLVRLNGRDFVRAVKAVRNFFVEDSAESSPETTAGE